jgi:PmbA protein
MTSTANSGGVSNVFIKPNTESQQDIISNLKTGVLVTELMGSSVNLVNGTYSRAASGFWIENGEIQYPISEVTIAGNLRDMFQNITAVGNDIDQRNSIVSGSILIENMTLAG